MSTFWTLLGIAVLAVALNAEAIISAWRNKNE
jgi:hypothetical protein